MASLYGSFELGTPDINPASVGHPHAKPYSTKVFALRAAFALFVSLAVYQAYTNFSDKRSGSQLFAVSTAEEDHVTGKNSYNIGVSPDIHAESTKTTIALVNTPEKRYLAYIESVECGFGAMRLACRVKVQTTQHSKEKYMMFVEYAPVYHTEAIKAVRSEYFKATSVNKTVSIEIYRLRAKTEYKINLYVMEKKVLKHAASTKFTTVGTGVRQFDNGPLVEVEGVPTAPLLNYAMHLPGLGGAAFRGVIVSDVEGYVVWYLNSSVSDSSAHLEAVEKSNMGHVWCTNDQSDSTVRIINAMGDVLAAKKNLHGLQGHECRFTSGKDKMRVVLLSEEQNNISTYAKCGGLTMDFLNKDKELQYYSVSGFMNEMIQVYEPNEDGTSTLVDNITLNEYFSFKDFYAFYRQSFDSANSSHSFNTLYTEFSDGSCGLHDDDGQTQHTDDDNGQILQTDDDDGQTLPTDDDNGQILQTDDDDDGQTPTDDGGQTLQTDDDGQTLPIDDDNGQILQTDDDDGQTLPIDDDNGQTLQTDDDGQILQTKDDGPTNTATTFYIDGKVPPPIDTAPPSYINDLRYMHASSVSVAEDGSLYIITFRNCHMVVGIDRYTHVKKFMLSSVVPSIGTHEFENDHHKFYAPHDVSYHSNSTVCLMDDGFRRPQGDCTDDDNKGCFSRAVCYYLDDYMYTVRLIWEFEYPHEMAGAPLNASEMKQDIFNQNGGSIRRVTKNDWVVSFTAVRFAPFNHSSWVFGLREDNDHEIEITSIQKLPVCLEWATTAGASGSYRATPIISINGELEIESTIMNISDGVQD